MKKQILLFGVSFSILLFYLFFLLLSVTHSISIAYSVESLILSMAFALVPGAVIGLFASFSSFTKDFEIHHSAS